MFYVTQLQQEEQKLVNELDILTSTYEEDTPTQTVRRIIAICGARKSGKGAVSEIIAELQPQFRIVNFADVLKHSFAEKEEIDPALLFDPQEKEKYRKQLIEYADEMRSTDPCVFARTLFDMNPVESLVIGDLRFIEELKLVIEQGGIVLQVYADQMWRRKRGWFYTAGIDDHMSETEMGYLSGDTIYRLGGYRVYNNSTVDSLRQQVARVLLDILR